MKDTDTMNQPDNIPPDLPPLPPVPPGFDRWIGPLRLPQKDTPVITWMAFFHDTREGRKDGWLVCNDGTWGGGFRVTAIEAVRDDPAPATDPPATREWCVKSAEIEGEAEIGAGTPPATEAKGCEGETPETDDRVFHRDSGEFGMVDYVVSADFARDLERKLGEANKARRVLEDAADHLNARLREEKKKLGEASTALEVIAKQKLKKEMEFDAQDVADWQGGYEMCVETARKALARIDSPDTQNPG